MSKASETGWTRDVDLWRDVKAAVGSLRWTQVPFAATSAAHVQKGPGVYLICASPPWRSADGASAASPALYTALYVGKGNVRSRFRRHTSESAKEQIRKYTRAFAGYLDFWFAPVAEAARMDAAEAALIHALRPPCNDQYPRLRGVRLRLGPPQALGPALAAPG